MAYLALRLLRRASAHPVNGAGGVMVWACSTGLPRLTHQYESFTLICMSKRLQVLLDELEWREVQRAARASRVTVAEWVRQALRAARARTPGSGAARKLDAIRAAASHTFPTADIDRMLEEIERGYLGTPPQ